jgi:hypothetical protein
MKKAFMLILLFLAATASAQDKAGPQPAKKAKSAVQDIRNFRISFTMKNHALVGTGNFVVMAESQSNYFVGTSTPSRKAEDPRKYGTIVNCMPVPNPNNGLIRAECQFELSAPPALVGEAPQSEGPLQLQTTFEAKLGHTLVLIDEPKRYIEVKFEEVAP